MLNIRWPKKIRSNDIYKITKEIPWSQVIAKRRLSWFGHLARLPDNTPAKRALMFALKPTKQPVGKPKTTWLKVIKNQLKTELKIPSILTAIKTAQNKKVWRDLVNRKCAM